MVKLPGLPLPVHSLERSPVLRLGITPMHLQGEACLDIRLWRRSEMSVDPEDFAPTSAGLVVPIRDVVAFVALVETAAREAQG